MATNQVPRTIEEHRSRLKYLKVEGGQLAYLDEGTHNKQVIVLMHGMPANSWLYRKVIPHLTEAGLRVIAPDLLGFGASDKPTDLDNYTLKKQANRIFTLMNHLKIDKWTQVCHDLGGPWTFEMVDRGPQHIEKLIVMDTSTYMEGFYPPKLVGIMGGPMGPMMFSIMRSRLMGKKMIGDFFKSFVGYPENLTDEVIRGYWQPLHEGATRPFRQFTKNFKFMLAQFDRYQTALRRYQKPAMIIWAKKDAAMDYKIMPAQFARDLQVPAERIHIFEDASHFMQEDKPQELGKLFADFVKSEQMCNL
ncbi:MAG: alpha/beta fold hydrolase [Paenibacillaceae bacterium]